MAVSRPEDIRRLEELVAPNTARYLTEVLRRWLQDAHDAARQLQLGRKDDDRGDWVNDTSFGTDRYQYLVNTAKSLETELDGLETDRGFNSLLLKLPNAAIYPYRVESDPYKPIRNLSELRTELLSDEPPTEELALFTRTSTLLDGRERLLLPWSGSEIEGCTGVWAGQGSLNEAYKQMDWQWIVRLDKGGEGLGGRPGLPGPQSRPRPDVFDAPPPPIPLRPHEERPHGSAD